MVVDGIVNNSIFVVYYVTEGVKLVDFPFRKPR